jgi:hypothetical protein
MALNISYFASSTYPPAKTSPYTEYAKAYIDASAFEVYFNGSSTPITSKQCTLEKYTFNDLTGIEYYNVSCKISVTDIKYPTKVAIKIVAKVFIKGTPETMYIWYNTTVARDTEPPAAPTFKVSEMGKYIYDLSAKDNVGILAYRFTIGKITYEANVSSINGKSLVAYYYDSEHKKVEAVNLTTCLALKAPAEKCVSAWKDLLKSGGVIVGTGKVWIIPPEHTTSVTVTIAAVDYGGNIGPSTTTTITYAEKAPDTYAIIILSNGWNMFAIPGVITSSWAKYFNATIMNLISEGKIDEIFCTPTGTLKLMSGESCANYIANPVSVSSLYTLNATLFVVHVQGLEKPEVMIIPVYFTYENVPVRVLIKAGPTAWSVMPSALDYNILEEIDNLVHANAPVVVYAWDPITHSFVYAGYGWDLGWTKVSYVPIGTLMLVSAIYKGTVVTIYPILPK